VTHGDQFGSPNPAKLHEASPTPRSSFWHSHRPLLELVDQDGDVMKIRVGAGAPRFGDSASVGYSSSEAGFAAWKNVAI